MTEDEIRELENSPEYRDTLCGQFRELRLACRELGRALLNTFPGRALSRFVDWLERLLARR